MGSATRWLSCDGSYQCNYDWLWAYYHEVANDKLPATLQAVCELEAHMKSAATNAVDLGAPGNRSTPHWAISEDMQRWLDIIGSNFHEHTCVPAALAYGFAGVPHKCAALAHMFCLKIPTSMPLREFNDTFASNTSDMGVELSISDFAVDDPEDLNPSWTNRQQSTLDIMVDADADVDHASIPTLDIDSLASPCSPVNECTDGPTSFEALPERLDEINHVDGPIIGPISDDPLPLQCDGNLSAEPNSQEIVAADLPKTTRHFLEESLPISGSQHTLNNLTKDIHKSLPGWDTFFKNLKEFETLTSTGDKRRRLFMTVFKDTPFEQRAKSILDKWEVSLHEPRFRNVLFF